METSLNALRTLWQEVEKATETHAYAYNQALLALCQKLKDAKLLGYPLDRWKNYRIDKPEGGPYRFIRERAFLDKPYPLTAAQILSGGAELVQLMEAAAYILKRKEAGTLGQSTLVLRQNAPEELHYHPYTFNHSLYEWIDYDPKKQAEYGVIWAVPLTQKESGGTLLRALAKRLIALCPEPFQDWEHGHMWCLLLESEAAHQGLRQGLEQILGIARRPPEL